VDVVHQVDALAVAAVEAAQTEDRADLAAAVGSGGVGSTGAGEVGGAAVRQDAERLAVASGYEAEGDEDERAHGHLRRSVYA